MVARHATTQCQVFGDQIATRSPALHAQVDHRRGGPADLVAQLGEGQPPILGDQRVVLGELVGNPVQDLRNGPRIVPCPAGVAQSSMLL